MARSTPLVLVAAVILAPAAMLAPACAGEGGGETGESGGVSDAIGATTGTSDATGGATGSTGSTGSTGTTGTTGSTGTTGTTGSTGETETAGAELCHFGGTGESGGSAAPWLELYHKGVPVTDGSTLGLECGFQGLFMLELVPYFGGFEPDDLIVSFSVTMDVEGFNLGPTGHFYDFEDVGFYIGCDVFDGGSVYILPILPPDGISKMTDLDGASGSLTVTLHPDGGGPEVSISAAVTIQAAVDEMWAFCGYTP